MEMEVRRSGDGDGFRRRWGSSRALGSSEIKMGFTRDGCYKRKSFYRQFKVVCKNNKTSSNTFVGGLVNRR